MPLVSSADPSARELPWSAEPLDVAAAWPADRPLQMLCSAHRHGRWARWSILAAPSAVLRIGPTGATLRGAPPPGRQWPTLSGDPLADLRVVLAATATHRRRRLPLPFTGGWIGFLSYDLGARLEPAGAGAGTAADDRGWPWLELAWCGDALVHDGRSGRWWTVGAPPAGGGRMVDEGPPAGLDPAQMASSLPRGEYEAAAARVVEYIRAGDVFQVNLAQRLTGRWSGRSRALTQRALRSSGAWYGAHLELSDGRRLVSLSPELFLAVAPNTRRVITRPIKGTRPEHVDRGELRASAKDAAELHMIVDLMRNDLGRLCRYGSIQVPHARRIETHPTVHHGVGEVHGVLRDDVDAADLLAATFPGGSITGAPKIRAMQIIDELEPVRRGPYCGAIGFFGDDGRVHLNIAIRTIMLSGSSPPAEEPATWTLDYGAGAGIVADSVPALEYRECLDKAAVLRSL
ncbi:MAG: anthranilate synthase component I family protein [Planctomycetota bacterium]|jgi:para-aminobenzoate synthetase component 1